MTRTLRSEEVHPGFPHHLIIRGNNRRSLFSYNRDREAMLTFMLRAHALEHCRVEALLFMKNHVHLVVTPDSQEALSEWMKSWEQRYAVHRNRQRDGSGKLFEQRFHCIPILSEAQLAATIPYAEINPVRAGLRDDAADWLFSTYPLHAGVGRVHELVAELWRPSDWWLSLSADPERRQRVYRAHVTRRIGYGDWADVHPDSVRFEPSAEPYRRRLLRPDGSRVAENLGEFEDLYGSRQAPNDFEELEEGE